MKPETRVGLAIANFDDYSDGSIYSNELLISQLVRDAIIQGGLGRNNPDKPLADIIEPGMTVLLKPNWVLHNNFSGETMDCMVTHPNFITTVLKEVLLCHPRKIIVGDAPIQLCSFDSLVTSEWKKQLQSLAEQVNTQLEIIDFRRTIIKDTEVRDGFVENARSEENYILFDLKTDSLLEPITPNAKFRITNYDPDKLSNTHSSGKHQYLLCREIFETDVVINLPKLKCHKKAGITGALKNLVGINGNKEFLPHHRLGGSFYGGDCYPGGSIVKLLAEFCLDNANRHIGKNKYSKWYNIFSKLLRIETELGGNTELEGSWYGNDTVWRMVLDLNRIFLYGQLDGTMADTPQRKIYSITDAIIAGEREGPLAPAPVKLGMVTFASSSVYAELVHTALMNFDWQKIPLVYNSWGDYIFPLTTNKPEECEIYFQNQSFSLKEITSKFSHPVIPPQGWKNHIEIS
ncbi:DUF362 domain-containing protein [Geminocystis sp. NIES-3709]|uniref:DUF362 domain-containing protein n=1 Tax=Geminocystis sp. NIES-3709 TaxID=1617448 RepID=UPI0005FCCDE8|nr:DUF362 domain-containing protein [Geminocystis sp. NIES-3709]BAQ66829.1 hypothetical protein GM3709_3594 [Geminocystis sp. NIES-3709]